MDHIGVLVSDLAAAKRLYTACLAPLGWTAHDYGTRGCAFRKPGSPVVYLTPAASGGGGVHLAFAAETPAQVEAFWAAALEHGAADNGAPGPRPDYAERYWAAFALDLEGNNLEAVCKAA